MKMLSPIFLMILWAMPSLAQDRISIGNFVQVNWFYGNQKNRNIDGTKMYEILDQAFCDPRNDGLISDRIRSLKVMMDQLVNFSDDPDIRSKVSKIREKTDCKIRLDVDMVGDFSDRHGNLDLSYAWRMSGPMTQSFDQSNTSFHHLVDAKSNFEKFVNRIPDTLNCSNLPIKQKTDDQNPDDLITLFIIDMDDSTVSNFESPEHYRSFITSIIDKETQNNQKQFGVILFGEKFLGSGIYDPKEIKRGELDAFFHENGEVNQRSLDGALVMVNVKKVEKIILISDGRIDHVVKVPVGILDDHSKASFSNCKNCGDIGTTLDGFKIKWKNAKLPDPAQIVYSLKRASNMGTKIQVVPIGPATISHTYLAEQVVPDYARIEASKLEKQSSVQLILSKVDESHIPYGHQFLMDLVKITSSSSDQK